jgi:hypothetical protein
MVHNSDKGRCFYMYRWEGKLSSSGSWMPKRTLLSLLGGRCVGIGKNEAIGRG